MQLINTINDIPMFKRFTEGEKNMFAKLEHSLLGFKKMMSLLGKEMHLPPFIY